jgi:hypothetical protein
MRIERLIPTARSEQPSLEPLSTLDLLTQNTRCVVTRRRNMGVLRFNVAGRKEPDKRECRGY